MKEFLGIIAHYIFNWEMENHMIACKTFLGRHTADNIRNKFEEIIFVFHLTEKSAYVISGNA